MRPIDHYSFALDVCAVSGQNTLRQELIRYQTLLTVQLSCGSLCTSTVLLVCTGTIA